MNIADQTAPRWNLSRGGTASPNRFGTVTAMASATQPNTTHTSKNGLLTRCADGPARRQNGPTAVLRSSAQQNRTIIVA